MAVIYIYIYIRPVEFESTWQRLKVSYFTIKLRSLLKTNLSKMKGNVCVNLTR